MQDPSKAIGLLMEYPDGAVGGNARRTRWASIRRDVPTPAISPDNPLYAPLLDKQAEWCEAFRPRAHHVAAAVRTCSCRVPRSWPGNGGPAGGV